MGEGALHHTGQGGLPRAGQPCHPENTPLLSEQLVLHVLVDKPVVPFDVGGLARVKGLPGGHEVTYKCFGHGVHFTFYV